MTARPFRTTGAFRVGLASAAFALALTACGSAAPDAGIEPDGGGMNMCLPDVPDCNDMGVGDPATDSDEPAGGDRLMAPDINIVAALEDGTIFPEQSRAESDFPVFLREATVDGATVNIAFSGGEAPCFWVSHVDVVETDESVTVTVYAGGEDGDCDTQTISSQAVTVTLAAPLGSRGLLDGSRTAPAGANT